MSEVLAKQLSEHPIFHGLPFVTVSEIIECATEKTFSRQSTIFFEGDSARYCYIILSGSVELSIHTQNKDPIVVQTLHGGDVLGWSWLFPPFIWHFDAIAKEKINTIRLNGECIRKNCQDHPELGYELMIRFSHLIQERLNAARLQLVDMYGKSS